MLGKPEVIATVLLVGGILLLFVDRWFNKPQITEEKDVSYKNSFIIGVFQVLSILFPGLSRSAATIVGGMQQKLTRHLAAEFSFFLAVPTMLAATVKSLWDVHKESPEVLGTNNIGILVTGSVIAFVVALVAVKFFIGYLQKHGFKLFGYYRIIVGTVLLVLIWQGYIQK